MGRTTKKITWMQTKAKISQLDRAELLDLVRDLYAASEENRTFLHSRFELGDHPLKIYKGTIGRWMWPDAFSRDDPSPAKAKQAISAYRRAVGGGRGLAELMIFYCEKGTGFCVDLGYEDEVFMNSLWKMFQQAVQVVGELPQAERDPFLARLYRVRDKANRLGYGISGIMDEILAEHAGDS